MLGRPSTHRSIGRQSVPSLAVVALLAALVPAGPSPAAVQVVTKATVPYPHFTTIQDAVNAAAPGDWVLIDVGVYPEAVYITTPKLHIRGMDRNGVIVDGQHQVGNGIEVWKTDGVWIENLTVRNFDRATLDGEDGNEIWWNGGDGSGQIGLNGWYGRYLTTYSDGFLAGYGIFTSNAVNGFWDNIYASGFNDSGIYLGACRDCRAKIRNALIENNALGYSGTNSGGHIIIEDSTFRNNSSGIGPNSLNNDDQPPPQDGACNSGLNDSSTPAFLGTRDQAMHDHPEEPHREQRQSDHARQLHHGIDSVGERHHPDRHLRGSDQVQHDPEQPQHRPARSREPRSVPADPVHGVLPALREQDLRQHVREQRDPARPELGRHHPGGRPVRHAAVGEQLRLEQHAHHVVSSGYPGELGLQAVHHAEPRGRRARVHPAEAGRVAGTHVRAAAGSTAAADDAQSLQERAEEPALRLAVRHG